jgi:hypothetical protein
VTGREVAATRIAPFLERRYVRAGAELLLVGLAFLLYFIVRGNVTDRTELALANARDLIDIERHLGVLWEADLQAWVLDSRLAVRFFNFVYFWLDFPLIAVLAVSFYFWRRPQYTLTRDALLISGAIALVVYYTYPVAPPRLVPELGVIDTLERYSNLSYQAQSTGFFVNPYAAMPSLHVGWSFLIAYGVIKAFPGNRVVLVLALLHPLLQSASTVFTGNHFLIDGAGGIAVAAIGLGLAIGLQRWGYGWLRERLGMG